MGDSSARIEPFVLLARSTKGAAAAKVIADATAAPGVYTFAELLSVPNIQSLRSDPSSSKSVALLDLFAYGTLQDYKANPDSFPSLSSSHIQKLKHLTLVTLALQHRSLPYDQISAALDVTSVRDLEDLVIDTIYAGLLTGKMHHHERILHVDWVAGRDLRPEDLQTIRQGLENWCSTASTLLKALDEQIARVRQVSAAEASENQRYEADQNAIVETLMNSKASNKGHFTRSHDVYDMAEDEDATMNGSAKGSGSGGLLSAALDGLGANLGGRRLGLSRKGQGSAGSEELARGSKRFKDSP